MYEYASRRSCNELSARTSDDVLDEELSVLRDYQCKVRSRRLVETVLDASRLTGTFPGGTRKQMLSSMLCREAARRGFVFPRRRETAEEPAEGGGLVLEPVPGIHDHVDVYDFKSYYPRFVVDRNMDEATALEDGSFVDASVLEGLLPSVLKRLVRGRDERPERSAAYKRVANACIGCLAISGRGRLYKHVTSSCRRQLDKLKNCAERNGARVVYGDTDSLFVKVGANGIPDLQMEFETTVGGNGWQKFVRRETYRRLLLTTAKKRYAYLQDDRTVGTVGMLNVRDDAEPLVSKLDRKLVEIALTHDDSASALEACAGAFVELADGLKRTKTISLSSVRRLSKKETNAPKFRNRRISGDSATTNRASWL
ncbi:DNA polymerase delta catalytic subunit-like [Anneissia japonica]|uniref:DNA polymerase delta catalytic subunit-like n=1 Tax=Anneissia japonica TaxID=1529436 RepID=UPI0014254DEE|nr:DNA polymerase delta catalytic subunit-like [Anneissia japonica]